MDPTQTAEIGAALHDGKQPRVAAPAQWAFRTVITLHGLDAFAQAVLAGAFLNGNYEMLALHRLNAVLGVVVLGYLQLLVALLYWRPSGGPAWPLLTSVGISAAESLQIVLGFQRQIGVHVPLGVGITAGVIVLATWAWRGTFGQRRRIAQPSTL